MRAPLGLRVVGGATSLADHRLLHRLMQGRVWIGAIALALMGLVFMQVSLLKLNTGIGRAVQSASTLERQNSELRSEVSGMASGDKLEQTARATGMVLPSAGSVHFLTAGKRSAAAAAQHITVPKPVEQRPLTSGVAAGGVVTQLPEPETPVAQAPAAATTAPATAQATAPAAQAQAQTPVAQTQTPVVPQTQAQPETQTQAPQTPTAQTQTPAAQTQTQAPATAAGAAVGGTTAPAANTTTPAG